MSAPRRPIDERLATLERKVELRRERIERNWHDVHADVANVAARAAKVVPLLGVASAFAVGVLAARRTRRAVPPALVKTTNVPGTLASIVVTLGSFAMSPQARALFTAWRSRRD